MKKLVKIFGVIVIAVYMAVAIFLTVCLLNYNDYNITELGKNSLIIVSDDDLEHYYFGRVTVNEWKSEKKMGKIVIEVDAEPYKMMVEETVATRSVSGSLL